MTSDRESRLDQVFAEFLQAAESGPDASLRTFVDRYPEFADELRQLHENYHWMGRLPQVPEEWDAGAFPRPFGDYELLEVLGRGGMGVVYRARHLRHNRVVALKTLGSGLLASAEEVDRFRREIRAVMKLEHSGIIPVYDVGEAEGLHYFTMRLVEGGTLEDHAGSYRDDPEKAVRLLIDIAKAVRHAHQRAIIHRDLKPGNVLLDEGRPQLVDFGLALEVGARSHRTVPGEIVGTLPYMAPEQTWGDRGLLTLRVDVYSLGAILYELLTGRPPLTSPTVAELLRKIREEEPRNPRLLNPRVDQDLATISLACLEKNPARRYENVDRLVADLERWRDGKPISTRPVGRVERMRRWIRRKPGSAALAVVSTLLVLVVVVALTSWRALAEGRRRERLENNASYARQIAARIHQRLAKWAAMVEEVARHPAVVADLAAWNRAVRETPEYAKGVDALLDRAEARRLQGFLAGRPHDDLENWQLLDAGGIMFVRTPTSKGLEERYFGERDYFREARHHKGVHVSTAYHSVVDGLYKFNVSCPLFGEGDEFLGVVAISIPTSRDWGLPDLGDDRRKAVLIARSDPSTPRVQKPLPPFVILIHPLLESRGEPLGFEKDPFPVPFERDCSAELAAAPRTSIEDPRYQDPFRTRNPAYDGPWLAAFAPVARTGMVVLVQQRDK